MVIVLVSLTALLLVALGLYARKVAATRREARIKENEQRAAATLSQYSRAVKSEIAEAMRNQTGVLSFSKITVPHSAGYKVSLELSGPSFRVYATPERYTKTARLSFFIDESIMMRAADLAGEPASEKAPEYPV